MKTSSPYWSALASSLSPYVPGEQPRGEKLIKLNTNENPYPPSPKVIEAIHAAATDSLKLYPDPSCIVMREAAASRWKIKSEQVFCGNGSDEILAFAFAAFFGSLNREEAQNAPLLIPAVSYSFYPVYASLWRTRFKAIPLNEALFINPEDYTGNSGGVVFPNPNAPTGRALNLEALKKIARAQEKNKKVFVIDEAYIAFARGEGVSSMIPFINEHPNVLVVRTLSKDASLAGLRSGYAAGNEELIDGLCRVRDSFNSYTVDRLAQAASAAAILDAPYYDEITKRVCITRFRTGKALSSLGFNVIPSEANFIFASPPGERESAASFHAALREKGILVRHFRQAGIEKYLRISIGTDDDMDAFLNACEKIIVNAKGVI